MSIVVPTVLPSHRERFLSLIRGQTRGLYPTLLRGLLWLASLGYGLGIRLRNLAWSFACPHKVGVPVISVGNLTVGGTGKTPLVEYLAQWFRQREYRVAILSRGYGSEAGRNDEALVLEDNLPDVPHLQGIDRAALAEVAISELESEILLLDDGFQHRRLHRDLDLVVVDASDPFGGGHLLPRGLLREPISSLKRAHAILLTRCDQVEAATLTALETRIRRLAPGIPLARSVHQPLVLVNSEGQQLAVEQLCGRSLAGFCGIGNPQAFRRTVEALGGQWIAFQVYPDHHPYCRDDIAQLQQQTRDLPPDTWWITTQKDLVKIRLSHLGEHPLWAVRIGLNLLSGQAELDNLLTALLPSHPVEP